MTDKVKLAAIKLKGIGSADRKWILSQLSVQERNKLDPVLAELDGIAFDQIFELDALVDFDEKPEGCVPDAIGSPKILQEQSSAQLTLEPDITINLRKIVARHSDVFLSLLVTDLTTEDDLFLSQLVDRARYLRILGLAKKRQKTISLSVISNMRVALIKTAERSR
ncbi:hypothetical protein D0C16_22965 [Cellvibrio sp. KY-GH-1]|uniref:hypothetical protein n=1 Tax=Cellvibrio sp. KY-GH-1 TaxID=2303332 RepID=UPI001245D215|nr:hypothetical protein [Cellvibrio sp. KY-GH-1]QEY18593.1 hypothetical protein D0C16_22965 [Cellvibrio sp. KY-GH-1]